MSTSIDDHDIDLEAFAGLVEQCVNDLAPLFASATETKEKAKNIARLTIESHDPGDPAACLDATRVILLGLTANAALRDATNAELTPAMRLQFYGKAVSLSKAANDASRAMDQRRTRLEKHATPDQLGPARVDQPEVSPAPQAKSKSPPQAKSTPAPQAESKSPPHAERTPPPPQPEIALPIDAAMRSPTVKESLLAETALRFNPYTEPGSHALQSAPPFHPLEARAAASARP